MAEQSLKSKTVKGVGWSAADALLGQGVTFLVGIILARLLSPDEYGLIGICLIFNTVLNGVVDSGFSNAIIRKKESSDDDYNTMFITNMVVSIILYITLFITSPLISSFFNRIELVSLIRVTGLVLIINALSITQVTNLTKRIDFKTKTKASLISAITSGVVGISMAYCGFGVWALVGQLVSKQAVYTICLWILNKWIPNFKFSLSSFHYMWGFGWKLMVSGLLENIWNQLYQVVVGKCYSPATLGQFTRSNDFANLFSMNFSAIVQRVSFPVLSSIQDDRDRLVAAYRRIIKTTMYITFIMMFALGATSEPLLYCLIGPQWHEAATYLPLICVTLSLYPLHAINLNMLKVQGRSDIFLILEIIKKIIGIIPIVIGVFVGIRWMLTASIVIGIINFFLNSWYTGKSLGYSSWMQIRDIVPSLTVAICTAISVYFLKYIPVNNYLILALQAIIGLAVVVIMSIALKMPEFVEIKSIIRKTMK